MDKPRPLTPAPAEALGPPLPRGSLKEHPVGKALVRNHCPPRLQGASRARSHPSEVLRSVWERLRPSPCRGQETTVGSDREGTGLGTAGYSAYCTSDPLPGDALTASPGTRRAQESGSRSFRVCRWQRSPAQLRPQALCCPGPPHAWLLGPGLRAGASRRWLKGQARG